MDAAPQETIELAKKHRFRSLKLIDIDLDKGISDKPFGAEYGKLDNGLTYYVRCNAKPKMRAALALAVRVGSVLEEEMERGVAHIVEHLAFSATKNYTNHEIVKFLESIGADLGACGNAYTSSDETVYELLVPIDKPGLLSKAISILAEFGSEIRISSDDLDNERGAVLEEYRGSRHASGRLMEARWVSILEGSKYAQRLPIGLESVIRTVPAEVAKQFYKKWYHLHNMAVIAVGDFPNIQSVIGLIKEHFRQPKSEVDHALIPNFEIPFHDEPRFSCLVDPEASGSRIIMSWKMPKSQLRTIRDYRNWLVEQMFLYALNQRYYKISYSKDPPFFTCSAVEDVLVCPIKAFRISSSCRENGAIISLKSILMELARIRIHGFSEREISVARALIMSDIESAYLEREKMKSSTLRYQYVQHFVRSSPVVGIEMDAQLQKTILPQISTSEVSMYSEKFRTSFSCVLIITEPRATVTVENIRNVIQEIDSLEKGRHISPREDDYIPEEIIQVKPNSGNIVQQSEYPDIGVKELILSNGMKVCYKCTDFKNDQIIFGGYSYGGYSELHEKEFLSCIHGSAFAQEIGMFGYKPSVLADMLAGKRADVSTSIGAYKRSFFGDCSPSDLETALQLVYQLFVTNVEPSEEDIRIVKQISEENIRSDARDPYSAFWKRVTSLEYGDSYFFKPMQICDLPKIDAVKACEYFNNCYRDPSTFTVLIVGNIDSATAVPLILDYLGGIPKPSNSNLQFNRDGLKGLPCTPHASTIRDVVRSSMVEAQCSVHISFPVQVKHETMMEEMNFVEFLRELLDIKLVQVLRFQYGQIYNADASSSFAYSKPSRTDDLHGKISIDFSCDPNVSSVLVDVALKEIQRLQDLGPSEEDISSILEIEQRDHENRLQENYYWLDQISRSYHSRFYEGNVGCTFKLNTIVWHPTNSPTLLRLGNLWRLDEALEEARDKVRKCLTPLTTKWALQTILPYPCRKRCTAVILMPQKYPFNLLNSLPQITGNVLGKHTEMLAGLAGLTILAFSFWKRHA